MDSAKVDNVPFILSTVAVILIEMAARGIDIRVEPLLITGAARIIDIIAVLTVFTVYGRSSALGLSRHRILPGIKGGILWSVGFGAVAGGIGIGLFIAGIDPLRWMRVHLPNHPGRLILFYIVGGAVGPVAEEIFFRGMVYGYVRDLLHDRLKHWGVLIALAVSTLLFAAAHPVASGVPLFQLIGGVVFCLAYEQRKSLLTPIFIHSLGNTALFTLSFIPR